MDGQLDKPQSIGQKVDAEDPLMPSLSNLYKIVEALQARIESLEANMAIAKSGQPSLPWV